MGGVATLEQQGSIDNQRDSPPSLPKPRKGRGSGRRDLREGKRAAKWYLGRAAG